MRAIDADALTKYFFRPYSNEESYSNTDIRNVIDKQPTIEPNTDTISRQAAIDALRRLYIAKPRVDFAFNMAIDKADEVIKALPSAQPETHDKRTKTHACDCISRQAAMEEISKQQTYKMFEGEDTLYLDANDVGSVLASLPSAQPEHTNSCYTNSWCIDCKEYDTENKCCPRYNRVIKQTLDDAYMHGETEAEARFHAQQRWIPCSERLPEEYGEYRITWVTSYAPSKRFIGDSEYEVTSVWDEERKDFKGEWLLDEYIKHYPNVKVIAWKPLEEPYREGES